ncbi:uncharacterized protein LOC134670711 [Cydia fagiglandana]|uniref:uncharacterized protein LOC134670711 n=1 Tax=Cydia fagiglandana TaxID=1458189 RepID=UPI002FEDF1F8
MGPKLYHVIFWLALMYKPNSSQDPDPDLLPRELPRGWKDRASSTLEPWSRCKKIKPTPRDVVRRICAVVPYFDREHQNAALLQRYRVTINRLSESMDSVDREVAFYAAVVTPIVFLQRYRDAKCLLERLQQSFEEFHTYPAEEKRMALKNLQGLRDISHRILQFVNSVPDKRPPTRTPPADLLDDEDMGQGDKQDLRFFKELVKNLG